MLHVPWLRAVLPACQELQPLSVCVCLQSVLNRMHVVSIPYALMKANPLSWIQKVCLYKGEEAAASLQPCCTAGSPSAQRQRRHVRPRGPVAGLGHARGGLARGQGLAESCSVTALLRKDHRLLILLAWNLPYGHINS